jgi:hypothetical protein
MRHIGIFVIGNSLYESRKVKLAGCGKSRSVNRFWVAQRFSAAMAAFFE